MSDPVQYSHERILDMLVEVYHHGKEALTKKQFKKLDSIIDELSDFVDWKSTVGKP